MIRRSFILALCLAALPASAQRAHAPKAPPAPPPPASRVEMITSVGRILIETDNLHAPISSANFLHYVDQKRLDGTTFYRTVRAAPRFGFVQFGVLGDPKRALPPIAHEPTTQTGIKHLNGTISTPRLAPGTARGDFTIMVGDQPSMDADPSKPGDNLGYAAFGHVVEGMDVVYAINDMKPSPTLTSQGVFKGEMLDPPVKIISARRVPMPVAPPAPVAALATPAPAAQ